MKAIQRTKQGSIFFRIFYGVLIISVFSNLIFAYIIHRGYETAIDPLREMVSIETFSNIEANIFNTWIVSASTFIFVVLMTMFFAVIFTQRIVSPIRELVKVVKRAAAGDLNIRVGVKGNDELAQLGKEFNFMIEQLKKTKDQLEEEKKVLEIKVRARTRELEELAETLDAQVKERTKELQERVNQLERFHKLTIGREMKMIELKKKIRQLEKELERCRSKNLNNSKH
ncbi:HAMP domain-containing protein [bacterium]|nr:HAMP domain-containing protein [bacterium]